MTEITKFLSSLFNHLFDDSHMLTKKVVEYLLYPIFIHILVHTCISHYLQLIRQPDVQLIWKIFCFISLPTSLSSSSLQFYFQLFFYSYAIPLFFQLYRSLILSTIYFLIFFISTENLLRYLITAVLGLTTFMAPKSLLFHFIVSYVITLYFAICSQCLQYLQNSQFQQSQHKYYPC